MLDRNAPSTSDLDRAIEALAVFEKAAALLQKLPNDEYVALIRSALMNAGSRGLALGLIEVELTTTQAIFTEELVELVGLDVNEAYRAAAILRSIVDPQVLGRAETKAVQMLESVDADDLTFTRLGHLLKGLNPGSVEIVIEVALARDNPDLDEVVAVLRRPSPRWRI